MELLVVIGIIGILAATIAVSLQGAKKSGRDARRVADIRGIVNALLIYYNEHGEYPPAPVVNLVLDNSQQLCMGGADPGWRNGNCDADQDRLLQAPGAPNPPDNPLGSNTCDATNNPYIYNQTNGGSGFEVSFCLGGKTGEFQEGTCIADDESIHCP